MVAGWINEAELAVDAWAHGLGWPSEALLRLGLAALAGGMIGIEREIRVKYAGFRTLMLVCVGSALAMLVSVHFAYITWPSPGVDNVRLAIDPGRIAYGVMTGIGFLGAGTIIQRSSHTRGLTTAAAIWCVAAIGLALGFGLYVVGFATTLLVLVALWLLDYLENLLPRRRTREITVRTGYRPDVIAQTVKTLRRFDFTVLTVAFAREPDAEVCDITVQVAYKDTDHHAKWEAQLAGAGLQILRAHEL